MDKEPQEHTEVVEQADAERRRDVGEVTAEGSRGADEAEGSRGASVVIATMIAASVVILSIGILAFISELSEGFKSFFVVWDTMGPLSGHVLFAYGLGILVFLLLFRVRAVGRQSIFAWTIVLFITLAVSSLFWLTPFVDLFH